MVLRDPDSGFHRRDDFLSVQHLGELKEILPRVMDKFKEEKSRKGIRTPFAIDIRG
jgi:hypothetical protein